VALATEGVTAHRILDLGAGTGETSSAVRAKHAREKRDLFARVHDALRRGGRFVLGDVVIADVSVAPLSDGYDKPDRARDQLEWLRETGFDVELLWERDDLALLRADRA
jgi:hypothetical protein